VHAVASSHRVGRWLTPRRRLAAIGCGLAALALFTWYQASASYTAAASAPHVTSTGDVAVTIGASGTSDNRLTIGSTLSPGDSAQRKLALTIDTDGSPLGAVVLSTSGSNGPPTFVTDATDGLQLWIARCSSEWTESGSQPDWTYACSGTQHDVLGTSASPVPVLQSNVTLGNLALSDGATNYLLVRLSFPATAPGSMLDESSDITFSWTGLQRAGTHR